MPQKRLGNEEFLTQLTSLLQSTHAATHGSIFLTQKPLLQATTENSSSPEQQPQQILIRATNGATLPSKSSSKVPAAQITKKHSTKPRIKLATVVDAADLDTFFVKYADACKKGMEGLRKRDKKKAKEKAKAKKKGKGPTTTTG